MTKAGKKYPLFLLFKRLVALLCGMVERKMTNSIEKRQEKPDDLRVKVRLDHRVRAIC